MFQIAGVGSLARATVSTSCFFHAQIHSVLNRGAGLSSVGNSLYIIFVFSSSTSELCFELLRLTSRGATLSTSYWFTFQPKTLSVFNPLGALSPVDINLHVMMVYLPFGYTVARGQQSWNQKSLLFNHKYAQFSIIRADCRPKKVLATSYWFSFDLRINPFWVNGGRCRPK